MSPHGTSWRPALVAVDFGSRICAQRYYRQRPAMAVSPSVIAKRCTLWRRRPAASSIGGGAQRQRGPMSADVRRRRYLRGKRRVAGHGGPRRRVHRRQLALSLPARREAVLRAPRRAAAPLGQGDVLEGNGAFYVFASEHGCILPLYKHPDVRGGHGTERVGRRLRCREQLIGFLRQAAWRLPDMDRGGMAATAIEG
jgi:hypothetical protein